LLRGEATASFRQKGENKKKRSLRSKRSFAVFFETCRSELERNQRRKEKVFESM
jgi:hypothetical protein